VEEEETEGEKSEMREIGKERGKERESKTERERGRVKESERECVYRDFVRMRNVLR
jgi:hypothetical protein